MDSLVQKCIVHMINYTKFVSDKDIKKVNMKEICQAADITQAER